MFLQLITPPGTGTITTLSAAAQRNADSLWLYHPLEISAIVETFWRNRYNALSSPGTPSSPFIAWPTQVTQAILGPPPDPGYVLGYNPPGNPNALPTGQLFMPSGEIFTVPSQQPGILGSPLTPPPSNWDHLIYAYLVENTRIFDVFSKVLESYMFSELLPTPSFATQQFLRNTEYLMFSDGLPTMIWTTAGRLRRDEIANRLTVYYWMFGIDLSHAQEIGAAHPYTRPEAANRDFIPTFEAFASEVWKGLENAKNTSGVNVTDDEAISTAARRIYDMMATRRLNGNLSREEFRAVALMSWLHLAVMYDSPVVQDLNAFASSPEQRLQKIAEKVGMSAHSKAKPLFDLSQAFSFLLQSIETGVYNTPATVAVLYTPGSPIESNAEIVIDQYYLATGRDLKAPAVTLTQRATTPRLPPPHALPSAIAARAARTASPRGNGRAP
jgi:hypothetical protein